MKARDFTDAFMDIVMKYIPNRFIKYFYKDAPSITPKMKTAISVKFLDLQKICIYG